VDVNVDESRGNDLPLGIQLRARRRPGQRADLHDAAVSNPNIGSETGAPRAIHNQAVNDDEIVRFFAGSAMRSPSGQKNQRRRNQNIPHHPQITQI